MGWKGRIGWEDGTGKTWGREGALLSCSNLGLHTCFCHQKPPHARGRGAQSNPGRRTVSFESSRSGGQHIWLPCLSFSGLGKVLHLVSVVEVCV